MTEPSLRHFAPGSRDHTTKAWPERGVLGKQLGPNQNGRKR